MSKKISIIGCGNIGTEALRCIYEKNHKDIIATRRDEEKLAKIKEQFPKVKTSTDNKEAAKNSDIIIIAVKPRQIEDLGKGISDYTKNKLIISIAAAISIEQLKSYFPNSRIARIMTGVIVSDELPFVSTSEEANNSNDIDSIKQILGEQTKFVDEEILDLRAWIGCLTGIKGMEAGLIIDKLTESGMKKEDAQLAVARMLISVGKQLEKGIAGKEIFESVGHKGSFTENLYNSLNDKGIFKELTNSLDLTVKKMKG